MKLDEIRSLSEQDLRARVTELREEQFRLRFRSATETLEAPLRLREVRRDIARALTVLREKELAAAPQGTKGPKGGAAKGAAKPARTKTAR
jgi:large subunit ribosomal protein L29